MTAELAFPLAALCGYLAGSIPFGLLITRAAGLGDIRSIGSGNIGATNVLRTGRKDLALATLLLDSLKAGLLALAFGMLASREVGFQEYFVRLGHSVAVESVRFDGAQESLPGPGGRSRFGPVTE